MFSRGTLFLFIIEHVAIKYFLDKDLEGMWEFNFAFKKQNRFLEKTSYGPGVAIVL